MDVKSHFVVWQKLSIFAAGMAKQYTDTDEVLRMINLRLRKLEKSDSEKTEEIGRLNRIIGQKDKEIHCLKMDLASTKSDLRHVSCEGRSLCANPAESRVAVNLATREAP